jgi:hypothetical protein
LPLDRFDCDPRDSGAADQWQEILTFEKLSKGVRHEQFSLSNLEMSYF